MSYVFGDFGDDFFSEGFVGEVWFDCGEFFCQFGVAKECSYPSLEVSALVMEPD